MLAGTCRPMESGTEPPGWLRCVRDATSAYVCSRQRDRLTRVVCLQVRLSPAESADVLKRWAEHLCSSQVNQKSKAILVLLSLGCFYKVGEMLHR